VSHIPFGTIFGTTDGSVCEGSDPRLSPSALKTVLVTTPPSTVTVTGASFQFDCARTLVPFTCTGNVTLTSTPVIDTTTPVAGQWIILYNVPSSSGNLTLPRGADHKMQLGTSNRSLQPGGSILLFFDGTNWVEHSVTTATST